MVRIFFQRGVALKADGNNHSLACFNLLQVADGFIIYIHLRCQYNYRHTGNNQRQGAVLQLTCRVSLRMNVGNLLQLQRTLQRYGIIKAASQEEGILTAAVFTGKHLNLVHVFQHFMNLLGHKGQSLHQLLLTLGTHAAAQTAYINRQHQHCQKLSSISLGRCHGNFRTGIGINNLVCLTRNRAADNVGNRQSAGAKTLSLAQCCQRIAGFTALADNNRQAVAVNKRVAVTEFTGNIHLNRHTRQLLQIIFADNACMISGTAGHNKDFIDFTQLLGCPVQLGEADGFCFRIQAASHGIAQSLGLFIDFLQHEMLKAAFFRCFGIPVNDKHLLADGSAVDILHPNTVCRYRSDFAVTHDKGTARMVDNCRNIGSDKVFTLAQADNQRIILFGADDFIRLVFAHKYQAVGAFDKLQHLFDGFFEISVILVSHQMSYNLAVRFGQEFMSLGNQLFLQAKIVFNNTVMDNDKLTAAVRMRMRVAIRRTAMCCPACVTDTYIAHRHIAR